MITEVFINSCFSLILNESNNIKKDKTLYRDLFDILNFYKKQQGDDIPINTKKKFECLQKFCEFKLKNKTDDNAIDSIIFSEKFRDLNDYLISKKSENLHDLAISDNIAQIRLRKRLISLFANHKNMSDFLDIVRDGSYESIDDVVLNYENIVRSLYTDLIESNKSVSLNTSSSLDLSNDDYNPILDSILEKYKKGNKTPSGYSILDQEILNGGFEPNRIYVFGGTSGSGKSALLLNFIKNASVFNDYNIFGTKVETKKDNKKKVFVYITLENSIEESFLRFYQCLFSKTLEETIEDISNKVDIQGKILKELDRSNSSLIMKYFPPASISSTDIMMVLDDVLQKYGKGNIKGLYVDYLDLLKTDIQYDLYRIELGHVTLDLKILAVHYSIPVITATQLSRNAYNTQDSNQLGLDQIGESIKKVEHSDFIALLSKDPIYEDIVHFKVGKNRNGRAGMALDFNVNFNMFRFNSCQKLSNIRKTDMISDAVIFDTEDCL